MRFGSPTTFVVATSTELAVMRDGNADVLRHLRIEGSVDTPAVHDRLRTKDALRLRAGAPTDAPCSSSGCSHRTLARAVYGRWGLSPIELTVAAPFDALAGKMTLQCARLPVGETRRAQPQQHCSYTHAMTPSPVTLRDPHGNR